MVEKLKFADLVSCFFRQQARLHTMDMNSMSLCLKEQVLISVNVTFRQQKWLSERHLISLVAAKVSAPDFVSVVFGTHPHWFFIPPSPWLVLASSNLFLYSFECVSESVMMESWDSKSQMWNLAHKSYVQKCLTSLCPGPWMALHFRNVDGACKKGERGWDQARPRNWHVHEGEAHHHKRLSTSFVQNTKCTHA